MEIPSFLATGALDWLKYGFHYPSPPPINLLKDENLAATNKWIVLAAVIERAKTGDFSQVSLAQDILGKDPLLDRVILVVLGSIGSRQHLNILTQAMRNGSDDIKVHAAIGAARSGYLSLVPEMVGAWHHVSLAADREVIGYSISDMLESVPDLISELAPASTLHIDNPTPQQARLLQMTDRTRSERFERAVHEKWESCNSRYKGDPPIWGGRIFSIVDVASDILPRIRNEEFPSGVIPFREKFEGTTGINCSSLFKSGHFLPNNAINIIERFLFGNASEVYEQGVRYFFSHRIPDS